MIIVVQTPTYKITNSIWLSWRLRPYDYAAILFTIKCDNVTYMLISRMYETCRRHFISRKSLTHAHTRFLLRYLQATKNQILVSNLPLKRTVAAKVIRMLRTISLSCTYRLIAFTQCTQLNSLFIGKLVFCVLRCFYKE